MAPTCCTVPRHRTGESCLASLCTGFLLCFAINYEPQSGRETMFLDWPANSKSATRPSARATIQVHNTGVPKICSFEIQSCTWHEKNLDTGGVNTGFWRKLETSEEWLIALLWRLTEEWGASSKARNQGATIFILPISAVSLQEEKQHHTVEAGIACTKPQPPAPSKQVHLNISTTGTSPKRWTQTPPSHQIYWSLGTARFSSKGNRILLPF